ncbi:MAG TPA: M23 family metallopeptidase [Candidatus Limnocylindrales bacterium]|nr:M23 family metallopeptidase [Candidatus Limnocylindrales bacterium]
MFILAVALGIGLFTPLTSHRRMDEAAASASASPVRPMLPRTAAGMVPRPPSTVGESTQLTPLHTYMVQPGDTILAIAARYGLSVETVTQVNNLPGADALQVGQSLTVPPVDGSMVPLVPGEQLAQVADQYRVDAGLLATINQVQPGGVMPARLFVPSAAVPGALSRPTRPVPQPPAADRPALIHFQWPTQGVITQPFWQYHPGIDIANVTGTPVVSADGGRVVFAGWGDYGLYVEIDHGNGYSTVYGHLSQLQVTLGQQVRPGQPIGLMGSTGRSTGPHLHFEIRQQGVPRNPLDYLR